MSALSIMITSYLNFDWDLFSPSGQELNIVVDHELDPVGTVYNRMLASSSPP